MSEKLPLAIETPDDLAAAARAVERPEVSTATMRRWRGMRLGVIWVICAGGVNIRRRPARFRRVALLVLTQTHVSEDEKNGRTACQSIVSTPICAAEIAAKRRRLAHAKLKSMPVPAHKLTMSSWRR